MICTTTGVNCSAHSPHTSLKARAALGASAGLVRPSRMMGRIACKRSVCTRNQLERQPACVCVWGGGGGGGGENVHMYSKAPVSITNILLGYFICVCHYTSLNEHLMAIM